MVYNEPKRSFPCLYGIAHFRGRKTQIPVAEESPYFGSLSAASGLALASDDQRILLRSI
jgi:hypothetical protein